MAAARWTDQVTPRLRAYAASPAFTIVSKTLYQSDFDGDVEVLKNSDGTYRAIAASAPGDEWLNRFGREFPTWDVARSAAIAMHGVGRLRVKFPQPPVRDERDRLKWQSIAFEEDRDTIAVVKGNAYRIVPDPADMKRAAAMGELGHYGREFIFLFADGRRVVSHNCYDLGLVPDIYREELSDNAEIEVGA